MSCSLKCFQVYGLKLNSFFFTKRDPLFPSFPPPYPLFFSSSKVQRISELITVFHQLFDLGMVTFSKHLLHPFPILLHFFFNLSSIFPITSQYEDSNSRLDFYMLSSELTRETPNPWMLLKLNIVFLVEWTVLTRQFY